MWLETKTDWPSDLRCNVTESSVDDVVVLQPPRVRAHTHTHTTATTVCVCVT
jgi:hypothetical protein